MKQFFKIILLVAFVALLTTKITVRAQETVDIENTEFKNVSSKITKFPEYVRFSFQSDNYINFSPLVKGNMLIIDFEKPNNINFSNLVGKDSIFKSFGVSPDNRSMIIRLNDEGVKLRKFVGDNFTTGLDIYLDNDGEKYERKIIFMSDLPQKAKELEAGSPPASPQASSIITYPLSYIGPPSIKQLYKLEEGFIGPLQEDFYKTAIYEIIKIYDDKVIEIEISENKDSILIMLPFVDTKRVGSAVRYKDNIITAVFNKSAVAKIPSDLSEIKMIDDISQQKNKKVLILNITLNERNLNLNPVKIFPYKNQYAWVIELSKSSNESEEFVIKPIKVSVENFYGENSVNITAMNIKGPFNVIDTKSKEVFNVFTSEDNGAGTLLGREFVDLKIYETLQGVFIREKSDFIKYKNEKKQLIISKLPNLIMSDEIISTDLSPDGENIEEISKTLGVFPSQSIFPFPKSLAARKEKADQKNGLGSNDPEQEQSNEEIDDSIIDDLNFYQESIDKIEKIIKAEGTEKEADYKLELAEFYFSKKMYPESLGFLYDIMITTPEYRNILKVRSVYAANLYLMNKFKSAAENFSKLTEESLNNISYNEYKLWKWFSIQRNNNQNRIIGSQKTKIDFLASYDKFMQQYPESLRFEFALIYLDNLIKTGDAETARNIFEVITYSEYPEKFNNHVKLLSAQFDLLNKNPESALQKLEELSKEADDRKNRAQAIFEIAKYNLINGVYDTDEAIDQFLLASTIWRDDFFEMDIYETVGSLYLTQERYLESLQSWENLVANFPQTTESIFVLGKMKEVFVELFDAGIAYEMEPLEALKIYFRYRELMPVGEVGDRITRKITQFFIQSDMVDDAIDILLHQIKYRSSGEEKAKLVLWLSSIYKDNRDLDSAIDVLDLVNNDASLGSNTRDLLKYELAYLKAKQELYSEGMALIKNDFSDKANDSRIELFWVRENWFGLIKLIESKLDSIKETSPEPLTNEEVSYLKKLLIAYSAQGENEKLKTLKNDFYPRLSKDEDTKLFDYLATGYKNINYNNFQSTIQLENIERFVNEYSFLPNQRWQDVIEVLEPKMDNIRGKDIENFTQQDRFDVVRLALAYTMIKPKDVLEEKSLKKKITTLARDFKDVYVDRFSIDAFETALNDKINAIENDAIFEGKIKLMDISNFLPYYERARKMSDLNISIRNVFK